MKKIIIKLLILVLIIQANFNLIDMMFKSSKAVTNIYIQEGETYTLTAETSQYTLGDSTVANVQVSTPTESKGYQGTAESTYNGSEVNLDYCLYTFTQSENYYTAQSVGNTSLYLYIFSRNAPYSPNYNTSVNLTITQNNGNFTFAKSSKNGSTVYLYFNTTSNYITGDKTTSSSFLLYRPIESGETSSSEITGYIQETSITSGKQYLVVAKNGNNYYALYPSDSTTNTYDQTVKIVLYSTYTITGTTAGTTTLTIGDNVYNITVYGQNEEIEIEPGDEFIDKSLIITAGSTYTLQKNITGTITWSSDDTSIATVDSNGAVTGVTAGTTTIKATSGNITYNIPVTVVPRLTTGTTRYASIHIDSDDETTLYYNYSYGTDFIEAHDGTRVYIQFPRSNSNNTRYYINFFAVPDEGYALSYMSGWYAPIVAETESEVQNGNGPYLISTTQNRNTTNATKATAVGTAYSLGAEGMYGYTVYNNNSTQTLTVRSEKLPEITQSVYSINGNSYSSGDVAHPGDEVIFAVTVSKGAYDYVVNYDGTLTSDLTGAVFLGTSPTDTGTSTSQSVSISTTGSYSETYYIKYTIPQGTTGDVTNTVTFDYESNGNPSTTERTGYVDSTASYKTDRTGSASATVQVREQVAEQKSYITLSKEVAGNMRETDKYFKFLVNIQGTSGAQYTITGQDSTITYNGSQVTTSSTYTVGNTNYVYLKDGQTITIGIAINGTTNQVPVGTTYSIIEQDAEEYITTIGGIQGETKTTGSLTIAASNNSVEFLNSRDAAAMTGRFFEITEYAIIFIGAMIFILLIKRQRKLK